MNGMRLRVGIPRGSEFQRAYADRDPSATRFFSFAHGSASELRRKAAETDARFDRAARARVARSLHVPVGADPNRLRSWVEEGGFVVTTGQQPALFGGPLYCVIKALTAVRLAHAAERELGVPVIPIYWMASEDHDWAEANHVDIVSVSNELRRIELIRPDNGLHRSLHRIRLGEQIGSALEVLSQVLPQTEFSDRYLESVTSAFTPRATLSGACTEFLGSLLGRFGIFFLDATEPGVKEATGPALLRELAEAEKTEALLTTTARELARAGFDLQVPILKGAVNLFLDGPAGRERLYRDGDSFRLRGSGVRVNAGEVEQRVHEDPTALSPNVLLRPVVESMFLPTLAYVAGPGETAYFGQLLRYFEARGVGMPIVHPRPSVTLMEAKVRKVITKFDMDPDDLARPFHEVATDFARTETPPEVRDRLSGIRRYLAREMGRLDEAARLIDPTLAGPARHAKSQAFEALNEFERKITHALKRENQIAVAQIAKAALHLFPGGQPAERTQSPLYYLARYGDYFLDHLHEVIEVNMNANASV